MQQMNRYTPTMALSFVTDLSLYQLVNSRLLIKPIYILQSFVAPVSTFLKCVLASNSI